MGGGREFLWEREEIRKLVLCGGGLEELLLASVETLGWGDAG